MARTPDAVLIALGDRLDAAGLTKAVSAMGAVKQPKGLIDRAWSVTQYRPGGNPSDRGRNNAPGHRVSDAINIELTHKIAPKGGQDQLLRVLQDYTRVIRSIVKPGTALTAEHHIQIGGPSTPTITGGGAYYSTIIPITATYNINLDFDKGSL